jgi:predicted class III extradiol MEMO1 family dioxygenase
MNVGMTALMRLSYAATEISNNLEILNTIRFNLMLLRFQSTFQSSYRFAWSPLKQAAHFTTSLIDSADILHHKPSHDFRLALETTGPMITEKVEEGVGLLATSTHVTVCGQVDFMII